MTFDQGSFDVRCEWGIHGVAALVRQSDVVVIVDVLSFSTCVEIATARGAEILPYRWKDYSARAFAERHGAELARARGRGGFSLSPESFLGVVPGARIVKCSATVRNSCQRERSTCRRRPRPGTPLLLPVATAEINPLAQDAGNSTCHEAT